MDRKERASELHKNGCNCAQAVACAFCKDFGIDENEMFRITEGFGLGMGVMGMCGALSGMTVIIGLDNCKGSIDEGSKSKGDTYGKLREYIGRFKEKNGSIVCREIKGVDTGKVLCSCRQCILDAVELTELYLESK